MFEQDRPIPLTGFLQQAFHLPDNMKAEVIYSIRALIEAFLVIQRGVFRYGFDSRSQARNKTICRGAGFCYACFLFYQFIICPAIFLFRPAAVCKAALLI